MAMDFGSTFLNTIHERKKRGKKRSCYVKHAPEVDKNEKRFITLKEKGRRGGVYDWKILKVRSIKRHDHQQAGNQPRNRQSHDPS